MTSGGQKLDVVLYGKDQPDRLNALAASTPGKPTYLAVRQIFNRLGEGLEGVRKAEVLHEEREALHGQLLHAERAAANYRDQAEKLKSDLESAHGAKNAIASQLLDMHENVARLQQSLLSAERENAGLQAALDTLQGKLRAVEQSANARRAALMSSEEAGRQMKTLIAELERETQRQRADMHTLQAQKQNDLSAIKALKAEKDMLTAAKAVSAGERDRLAVERNELVAQNAELNAQLLDIRKVLKAEREAFESRLNSAQETFRSATAIAGKEIGRCVQALLAVQKGGLFKKRPSFAEQARIVIANGLVDAQWYLVRYPDVAEANMDAAEHYVQFGASEGRIATPVFDDLA